MLLCEKKLLLDVEKNFVCTIEIQISILLSWHNTGPLWHEKYKDIIYLRFLKIYM